MKYLKLIAILVVLVFTWLFLRTVDFEKVGQSLQQVGFNFIWLILASFASYFCGTIAWRYCMGEEGKKIPLGKLFITRHIGETVGIVNPTSIVAGEAVKIYLLCNHAVQRKTVITSVLLSRVLMMVTQLIVCLCTSIFVVAGGKLSIPLTGMSSVLYGLLLIVVFTGTIITFWQQIKSFIKRTRPGAFIHRRTAALRLKITEARHELGVFYRTNRRNLLMSVLFFIIHWLIGSIEFYLILKFLGIAAGYFSVVFVDMGVTLFKSAGAFVPGQIGVEEYGNKVMLAAIGIATMETWATVSVLRRARLLFWIAFGLIAYLFTGIRKDKIETPDGTAVY